MTGKRLPWLVILATTVFVFGEYTYYYSQLPDDVASHFDAQGRPDASMAKDKFVGLMAGTWILTVFVLALPIAYISRLPASLMNLPRKDYWLAPERNESSRRYLAGRMAWIAAATFLFLAYVFHAALMSNLPPNPKHAIAAPLTIYLVFIAYTCVELIWRFSRVPEGN